MTNLRLLPGALLCMGVLAAAGCDTCDTPPAAEDEEPETAQVGLIREVWKLASPPSGYTWESTQVMWWYTKDREVLAEDILPGVPSMPGASFIPVLEMDIRDFKYSAAGEEAGWAGIQCLLSETGEDISMYEFVEIWLRQKQGDGGLIHIDVGDVSEDFYRPWRTDSLHTEDKDGDGHLSTQENTGYDGVPDGYVGDDPDDDYYYNEDDPDSTMYAHINGTERDPLRVPDTEDMDKDGVLDTEEVHFRFSLDVTDTTYRVHRSGEWAIHRIPLSEAGVRGDRPQWSSVKYVRVFFTEVERSDRFQLARFCFADSSWVEWLEPYLRPPEDL